ncbi:uncharacterized protein si:ch211-183d21.1 isoform X1 [Triplophysa dalaica]|uniref:uncharacterized protein si:ch211-183d21.1 isoform X1 n=1 Tax=Triplophysa dalaica TaxID=1582913 RepID=UPI0024DFA354|nr:uncharacterized protein si:ch211-183d21.1 isoform X1 [Triplophysa dalaica]
MLRDRAVAMRGSLPFLVCVLFMCVLDETSACLIISEVNCDNPSHDTQEFVELYSEGTDSTSLDGYTLVFYNGNGDFAYRIINLTGHHTDKQGYFLVGSSELTPRPAISLPTNSIQNGPDAIALYGPNWAPVLVNAQVSGVGLLDAVVYTSRKSTEGADGLASVLTPGSVPYVEDEKALEGDESIQRCWQSNNLWTFHTGPPTPGGVNHCPAPTPGLVWINEVDLGGTDKRGMVELHVGVAAGSFSVVLYDISTDLISTSVELSVKQAGIFTVSVDTSRFTVQQSVGLAVYKGLASNFPKDGPLSPQQPIDAFVLSDTTNMPSDNLMEMLIPGRKPVIVTESLQTSGFSGSRCGIAEWTRDPGLFVKRPPSHGKPNDCSWFQSCPRNITSYTSGSRRSQPPFHSSEDFLISEINTDSPGSGEDEEFIELWHPYGSRMFLDFIWLVMINGQTGTIYYELELNEYYTDEDGFFLIGSAKVGADITIPANTIQNGPDAIALYRSESPPSKQNQAIPRDGLLDAIVYRARGSDKNIAELTKALTPGQRPLLEDINASPGDESLSRCGTDRFNLSAYRVSAPTPRKQNGCPPKAMITPGLESVFINEVGRMCAANQSAGRFFVELMGPPLVNLQGFVLVFVKKGNEELSVSLKSASMGKDGMYLVDNVFGADLSSVVLCFEASGSGVCDSDSLETYRYDFKDEEKLCETNRFDSASRCASVTQNVSWIYSQATPHLPNLCPSPSFSTSLDLCIPSEEKDWKGNSGNCTRDDVAVVLEKLCNCGISALHLQGVNVSCESGIIHAHGPAASISDHQREQVNEILKTKDLSCSAAREQQVHGAGSSVGLQVGLVLIAVLLFGLGTAVFVYLYKRRRPADYLSMQMSEQPEMTQEL